MSKRKVQPSAEVTILVLRDLYRFIGEQDLQDVWDEFDDTEYNRKCKVEFDALLARAETVLLAYGMIRKEIANG